MATTNSQYIFSPWLTPVRVVSTINIAGVYYNGRNNDGVGATFTIASSSLTIDGVTVNVGDRVLLQNQTATYTHGIYVVLSIDSTVVLQRAEDMQSLEQIQTGQYVSVKAGSLNAGDFFTIIEPRPQIMGVSPIIFSEDPAATADFTTFYGQNLTEMVTGLDIFNQTKASIFSVLVPKITAGNILQITSEFEATNPFSYNTMIACWIILTNSPTATLGTLIDPANDFNISPAMHHGVTVKARNWQAPSTFTNLYVNTVAWAGSSNANPGDTLIIEQGYGHLDVLIK